MKTQTKCLLYARCSTRDQELENQLAQLRDYAAKQGWLVVEEVVDVCSGGKSVDERSGLTKVFDLGRRRKFDLLLFWALDRFSREGSRKTISYLSVLDDCGVDWHSYSEPYISSLGLFKDAIIAILSALAKQERIRISERTKAGLERTKKVNGTRLGRPWTPAERIQRAKELRSQGMTYKAMAAELGISRARACQLVHTASAGGAT